MPGVPSSKGCEACRKAKKKVILFYTNTFRAPTLSSAVDTKLIFSQCDELHPCSR